MDKIDIRQAKPTDAPTIYRFIRDLAIYEKAEHEVLTTEADIVYNLFEAGTTTSAIIASINNEPVGFAVYFLNYSTWLGKHGIFLEDLYVSPKARGKGIGKRLLKQLARIAVENNYGRVEWNVLDWNTPAIDFYESIGAKPQSEWVGYRMQGEMIQQFASEPD